MATVMLVLPTHGYRTAAFLDAARALGFDVVVAADEPSSVQPLLGDGYTVVDLAGDAGIASAAELARRRGVGAVVGVDEAAVVTAAQIAAAAGIPHNSELASRATRNKHTLRVRLGGAGVTQPAWRLAASDGEGMLAAAAEYGFPLVVKPLDLAGSRGVIRADDLDQLLAAASRLDAILHTDALCAAGPVPVLVEQFKPGPEIAVEALIDGGRFHLLAIFDKPDPLNGPFFEETLLVSPSTHPQALLDAAVAETQRAVTALGLVDGPIHAELRLNGGEPVVIEVAARSIGGRCSAALRFDDGETLEAQILRQAMGLPLGTLVPADPAFGALMLPIPASGRLIAVDGVDEARGGPGVVSVEISIPLGGMVTALPEGDRYLGFVIARGPSRDDVEAALRRAGETIRVTIEPRADLAQCAPSHDGGIRGAV